MNIDRLRSWAAPALIAGVASCAGNGKGLDQNGQPLGSTGGNLGGPVTADFQSIQDNVFTPICSKCHVGGGAPEGLQLDAAHSYNLLVGVPSTEQANLLRVKPSDPGNSYLLHKIEGAPGILGAQMPFGEAPLPQATIAAITQWIVDGAPNVPAGVGSFSVQTTAPLDATVLKAPVTRIVVTFSQDLDASLVNESTITLERTAAPPLDLAAVMTAGDTRSIAAHRAVAEFNPSVLLITPAAALESGSYRVKVRGTGGGAVANQNATTLGSDISFVFTVEPAQ